MKINYKDTALKFLDDPDNMEFNLPTGSNNWSEYDRLNFGHMVRKDFKPAAEMFKKNIRYISAPFLEAYLRGKGKLKDILFKTEIEEAGTLIYKLPGSKFTQTWFYMVNAGIENGEWNCKCVLLLFTKHKDNDHISLDAYLLEHGNKSVVFLWEEWGKRDQSGVGFLSDLLLHLVFLKYCELDTKVIKAGRKDYHIGTKYVNETKYNVEILDSTWFTTIVRSDGFHVRGHFRFQPCGQGMKDRKLIWITDYDKEGYTRTAKILNQ